MFRVLTILAIATALSGAAADLERDAREIESMLIAPCCFSQQVSVHQSPAADEVRADVRVRLAAGQTRREILDAYVARYGKRILAEPPAEGFDLTLYLVPIFTLLLSGAALGFVVRRFARRKPQRTGTADATAPPADVDAETRLDDELRDLD
jgi:cytochrome c-type biogenesis protein CcmH